MAPVRIPRITPHVIIKILFLLLAVAGLFSYGIYQARALIGGPEIVLEGEPTVISDSPVVEVSGRAENITKLTLNGQTIHTDESGIFTKSIMLPPGYTIITLSAEDRYGRTTSVTRAYVYTQRTLEENA